MKADATREELDVLGQLVEDGWPVVIITSSPDDAEVARFQRTAISLLHQRLAGVYDDRGFIPFADAEAIIARSTLKHEELPLMVAWAFGR